MRVAIIGCCKKKNAGRHKAKDLYQSVRFKMAAAYATSVYDRVYIVSAKHGLVGLNDMIESYDQNLKNVPIDERRVWARRLVRQIRHRIGRKAELHFFCGEEYRKFALLALENPMEVPLLGLRQGEQLRWLKQRLGSA